MELWIRSQDKERLMKATDIRIYYAKKENIWVIEDCDDLGYYQTKERALEVLDEIQNILMPRITYTPIVEEDIKPQYTYRHFISEKGETNILELSTYVYEMPKE